MASIAYVEQVGVNLHCNPITGLNNNWYPLIKEINALLNKS